MIDTFTKKCYLNYTSGVVVRICKRARE